MINLESNLETNIQEAMNWLLDSGIQNLNSKSLEVKGSFNSWYDIDKKDYFYAYSEAAGYGISTLLFLNSINQNNLYLLRSILAAEWMIDKASHKSGGLKTRYYYDRENAPEKYDFSSGIIHSFDNGIILSGLVELYKKTNEKRYLENSKKIGDFLLEVMQNKEGNLHASYSHRDEEFKDNFDKWSTQSGSYHTKVNLGLLKLHEVTKETKYKDFAIRIAENALKFQEDNGRFISYLKEKDTHLHPHCYSAEGLLFSGLYLDNKDYIKSSAKATEWSLETQMENGGVPSMYINEKGIEHERTDALSQVLRLGTITLNLGIIDKKYKKYLDGLKNRLLTFQYKSKDIRSNGGFLFGDDTDYKNNLNFSRKNHVNSWCTMFALQSLIYYKDYLDGNLKFDYKNIV